MTTFKHAVNNNFRKEDLMGRTLRLVVPKIEPPYVSNRARNMGGGFFILHTNSHLEPARERESV